jgi:glycosyltransferase involved in cell wall biosynthesis
MSTAARARADVSVVLCSYSEKRWDDLVAAVESVRAQTVGVRQIVVVIDNNPQLVRRVKASIPGVSIIENTGIQGAGEARNCGVDIATGSIVAFLDDDAMASPDWIAHAVGWFEDPSVLGVGGTITPSWDEQTPRWMADEFYWTVGCTYRGLPSTPNPVRNLIATNMFVRREAFVALGGFRSGFGKTGARSGTEETDLCIRASQRWPQRVWLYDPTVVVTHRVPRGRSRLGYFVARCYDEGVAKASIVGFLGARDGLAAERFYMRHTLPSGFAAGIRAAYREAEPAGIARSLSIVLGVLATIIGYLLGKATIGGSIPREPDAEAATKRGDARPTNEDAAHQTRVLVVGSSTHFISGVSHYTRYLARALSERSVVSVVLMRRLIPRALYPGRARVGNPALTDEEYPAQIPVFDGVDWYWLPSMLHALRFFRHQRPDAVLLQWWTGAVLHSYVLLALAARVRGVKIIIEIHEIQDSGEAGMAPVRSYVHRFGRKLMGMADAYIVHSEFDRQALERSFGVTRRSITVVRHGPYSHYAVAEASPLRDAPTDCCNILFFGTIRPYKGLEDLVRAFEKLAARETNWWLTVVGETWEDWTEPTQLIAASKYRDRITLVNRYVPDAEVSRWFAGADIVALPYRRSSASGPLHLAMNAGLPIVVSDVGGLGEATDGYAGAILVPGANPEALQEGLRQALALRGVRFEDTSSWTESAEAVLGLIRAGNHGHEQHAPITEDVRNSTSHSPRRSDVTTSALAAENGKARDG